MDQVFIAHVKAFVPFLIVPFSRPNAMNLKNDQMGISAGLFQYSHSHRFMRAADP